MNRAMPAFFRRLYKDQSGAVAMIVAVSIVAIAGMSTLVVDVGNVINAQWTLQASSNAAALAGAADIGSATANPNATATTYSSAAGQKNAHANLTATMTSVLRCFTSTGVTCVVSPLATGSPNANGIVVTQTATVSTFIGSVLGIGSVNIAATATAGAKGGKSSPVDAIVIIDTTGSMSSTQDSSCKNYDTNTPNTPDKLDCAQAGFRALLGGLWPTADQVGLFVFPGLKSATAATYEYDCNANTPSSSDIAKYSAAAPAPVYQVVGLVTDYKSSNTGPLNTASNIVRAAGAGGAGTSCVGVTAVGGMGTFYADAIKAAQANLSNNGRTNVQKVIILLSDGDASASSGNMPSTEVTNQCHQAITAAQNATNAGFWVYSVAYGAPASGCSTDVSPSITPCNAMKQIASDSSKFFADTSSSCPSGTNPTSGLVNLFQNIGTSLTSARMLSNNAT